MMAETFLPRVARGGASTMAIFTAAVVSLVLSCVGLGLHVALSGIFAVPFFLHGMPSGPLV